MDYIKLKQALTAGLIAGLLILCCVPKISAASFNFKASEQYLVKGEAVTFTFTYDPEGEAPPDTLEIEFYHNQGTLYNESFSNLSGGTFRVENATVFNEPGYFDVNARFTSTRTDPEGDTQTQGDTLGPIRINVANWKFTNNGSLGCIESTPVVSQNGDTVYVGSEDGSLYAIDAESGTKSWQFRTNGPIDSAPALDASGNIYFGSEDGRVYCLEPTAGALVWQFPLAGQAGRGSFFSSPALDQERGRLYIGSTDRNLHALNLTDGSLEWSFTTGAKIVSSPVVGHDHSIYVGSLDEFLYAVSPDGTEKWQYDAGAEIRGGPALDEDGSIFVGTCSLQGEVNENNGLHAVSPSGMKHWFTKKSNGFPSPPVITNNGTIVIGSYDNKLYGSNRSSGGLTMYKTFDDDVLSSAAFASNGYLFAGARDGIFYAVDPTEGNQFRGRDEFWQYDLSMEINGSAPVVRNGFAYVGACSYEAGALFSFVCKTDEGNTDIGPADDAPWPQARHKAGNTGKTDFTPETIAPAVATTDPEPGTKNFNTDRDSISVTFTMPMEPGSIYEPPDPNTDSDGYFGLTVEPFEAPDKDFTISSNAENTRFTLTLPEGSSFKKNTTYTATILSRASAATGSQKSILYNYSWNFSQEEEASHDNSHDSWSCFIETLFD